MFRFAVIPCGAGLLCAPAVVAQRGPARAAAGKTVVNAGPAPTGPTVVFETNRGRITCKLFGKEKPVTVALFTGLAAGKIAWMDATANATVTGKPMYDATVMYGVSSGAAGGRRINVVPGAGAAGIGSLQPEASTVLKFDRPGRLAMRITGGQMDGRSFYVLDHAEERTPEVSAGIFGQCDEASVKVVSAISHELLSVDNHSASPVVLNRVAVLAAGEPLPAVAAEIPLTQVDGVDKVTAPLEAIVSPEPTGPTVHITTTVGPITCKLFTQTPIATENFIGLATGAKPFTDPKTKQVVKGKHFYDGLSFGRVVPDFMIQNADLPDDPSGGEEIGFHFGNEIVPGLNFDRPGRLAYANGGPDTNESEFFITEHPLRRLDGSYTIFGQCDDASVKVVEAIARVPRNAEDHALRPVRIVKVLVE
ncbi:peptidylprolyl isomerase [Terriglobus sp.]|uniref:peptidylprolyl isomerase n=1 Tax=Terriglobus sp. TaxID=1889013 RepID=UPI003AFFEFEA